MSSNAQHALNDCLIRLDQGQSLEECLERYPQWAEELEPLLRLSLVASDVYQPGQPSATWLSQTRGSFLDQAAALGENAASPYHDSLSTRIASWVHRMARFPSSAQVGVAIALVLCLLGWSKFASARSLPGDPLYGVKRASEQVRVLLTTDADALVSLERSVEERRVAEVKQVVEQKRETQVEFSGLVEKVNDETVTVEGIAVQLGPEVARARPVAVGAKVQILAHAQPSGLVVARALSVLVPAPPPTPTPEIPTDSASRNESPPTPTTAVSAQPTAFKAIDRTATPTPVPVEMVEPTATASATDTNTPPWKRMPLPTFGLPYTPTPPPASSNVRVRISGRIDRMYGVSWVVAGHSVRVAPSTRIRQDKGPAQVGSTAIVYATRGVGNTLVAYDIVIVSGPEKPKSVTLSGIIEAMGGARWTISGQAILISKNTVIVGTPVLGALASVQADQYADQRLEARSISVKEGSVQIVQISGAIQSLGTIAWSVGGRQIYIGAGTVVSGEPELGAIALVVAIVRGDGSLLAQSISVQTTAEPEPAEDPSATATKTSTSLPPTRAIASVTPSLTRTTSSPTPNPTVALTATPTVHGADTPTAVPTLISTHTQTPLPSSLTATATLQITALPTAQLSPVASKTPLPAATMAPTSASPTTAPAVGPTMPTVSSPATPTSAQATATRAPTTPIAPTAAPTDDLA